MMKKQPKQPVKIELTIEGASKNRQTKETFRELMKTYKLKNPVKYEQKKAALEKQLAALSD
jgi:hypothetical protein